MTKPYDIAVIGGGIVGLATAMALTSEHKKRLIVLEAEDKLAAHQTGNNSGVIHSGLYYKPGSLKANNCVAGREALYRFCEEHNIACERCGKVVVAASESELPRLERLEEEPNDSHDGAQPVSLDVVINGRIEQGGDLDRFAFTAMKDQRVVIECRAERIDSTLRAVMEL